MRAGEGSDWRCLTELARVAVARGCGRVDWAVLDWNEPSIQFYRKLGAEPKVEWTTFRLSGEPLRQLADRNSTRPPSVNWSRQPAAAEREE